MFQELYIQNTIRGKTSYVLNVYYEYFPNVFLEYWDWRFDWFHIFAELRKNLLDSSIQIGSRVPGSIGKEIRN